MRPLTLEDDGSSTIDSLRHMTFLSRPTIKQRKRRGVTNDHAALRSLRPATRRRLMIFNGLVNGANCEQVFSNVRSPKYDHEDRRPLDSSPFLRFESSGQFLIVYNIYFSERWRWDYRGRPVRLCLRGCLGLLQAGVRVVPCLSRSRYVTPFSLGSNWVTKRF